jgi:NAD(P)-dependent dehydrogenase (short-subunit alcohol dehydrogenase family)
MRALVTGASRGIGRAVAAELAARGLEVVAAMRTLADVPDGCEGFALDVTRPGPLPDVDILVNNAGVDLDHTPVEDADLDAWRSMFETNVLGLVAITQAVLPGMRTRGSGVLCNVTSSSILVPVPFYAGYRASKAAVSAVCDSLRVEVARHGIRVHEILPGPIDTDMLTDSRGVHPAARFEPYREQAESMQTLSDQTKDFVTSTADAAKAIADVVLGESTVLRHGCDPMSVGLLEGWRAMSDEGLYEAMGATLQ